LNGWLSDTNILSELQKPAPERRVTDFFTRQPIELMFVSVIGLAEIRFGIELATGQRRAGLELWLEQTIRPMFGGRVLPLSEEIMVRWRWLVHDGRKAGETYPQPDLFLAATALQHNLTLVTRNTRDFAGLGLRIYNPWDDQP
jgi:predicted nucleic acid-binding protein